MENEKGKNENKGENTQNERIIIPSKEILEKEMKILKEKEEEKMAMGMEYEFPTPTHKGIKKKSDERKAEEQGAGGAENQREGLGSAPQGNGMDGEDDRSITEKLSREYICDQGGVQILLDILSSSDSKLLKKLQVIEIISKILVSNNLYAKLYFRSIHGYDYFINLFVNLPQTPSTIEFTQVSFPLPLFTSFSFPLSFAFHVFLENFLFLEFLFIFARGEKELLQFISCHDH